MEQLIFNYSFLHAEWLFQKHADWYGCWADITEQVAVLDIMVGILERDKRFIETYDMDAGGCKIVKYEDGFFILSCVNDGLLVELVAPYHYPMKFNNLHFMEELGRDVDLDLVQTHVELR